MWRVFFLVSVNLLTACSMMGRVQTPHYAERIEKIDRSLQSLQRLAVGILPLGLSSSSSNGREYVSRIFILDQGSYKSAGSATTRYFATVTVLGDSRPYAMEVYVTREQRVLQGNDYTYVKSGHDTRLAKQLADAIRTRLTKSREDLNIIDDFRVF